MQSQEGKKLIRFSFKETEPDLSTFQSRFTHFWSVTNPKNFFVSDQEIRAKVELVKKYKELANSTSEGSILISEQEKRDIMRGVELMNASTNDVGDLVFRPFRMCGFVPINIPVLCGIILSKPTMFNTILWQWVN
jgi:hypothetical protein